jgi:hypothetical protein
MIGLFIILLVNIVACIIIYIPSTGMIIDNESRGLRRIQPRGWMLIACFVITNILSIWQYNYNKRKDFDAALKQNEKDSIATLVQEKKDSKKDSIAKIDREESNDRIIRSFTGSLAEYGLKYDSTQRRIEKLVKDSVKRSVTVIEANNPTFSVVCSDEGITLKGSINDTLDFTIKSCYKYFPRDINIDLLIISAVNGQYHKYKVIKDYFVRKTSLNEDGNFPGRDIFLANKGHANTFYFYFTGKYTNREGTKMFPLEEVYLYDLKAQHWGIPNQKLEEEIRTLFGVK